MSNGESLENEEEVGRDVVGFLFFFCCFQSWPSFLYNHRKEVTKTRKQTRKKLHNSNKQQQKKKKFKVLDFDVE